MTNNDDGIIITIFYSLLLFPLYLGGEEKGRSRWKYIVPWTVSGGGLNNSNAHLLYYQHDHLVLPSNQMKEKDLDNVKDT